MFINIQPDPKVWPHIFQKFKWQSVIFSIKDQADARIKNVMLNMFSDMGVVPLTLLGCYNGAHEMSWLVSAAHMDRFIALYPQFAQYQILSQESFLMVSSCNKQYAALVFDPTSANPRVEALGSMHEVSSSEALASGNWSYRPDTQQWFICKSGNPDGVPPPQGWPTPETKARIGEYIRAIDAAIYATTGTDTFHPVHRAKLVQMKQWLMAEYLGDKA